MQYQEQRYVAVLLLVKSQSHNYQMYSEKLIQYCLVPAHQPWNTAGFFSKLNISADMSYPQDVLFQDRTTLLHNLTNLPPTCGEICLQVLDQMVAKKQFLFSTDSYHPQSIKFLERLPMTTTTSSSATSCCEYGVLNRQHQSCREPRWLC